jgi:hypothetical protein
MLPNVYKLVINSGIRCGFHHNSSLLAGYWLSLSAKRFQQAVWQYTGLHMQAILEQESYGL